MSDRGMMRPIRKEEYNYWDYTTDTDYEARKSSLKSEMIDEIDDISENNYPAFKGRLKLDKLMSDIVNLHKEDHEALIKKLCREETEKAYYAGPKGKALQLLEISKKRAKHILNSGLPLNVAVMKIAQEGASQKINFEIPQDVFNPATAIENKK